MKMYDLPYKSTELNKVNTTSTTVTAMKLRVSVIIAPLFSVAKCA